MRAANFANSLALSALYHLSTALRNVRESMGKSLSHFG
jgi:hypothetical protein